MNNCFAASITAWKIIGEYLCETFLEDPDATSYSIEISITVKEIVDGREITSPSRRRLDQTYSNKVDAQILVKHFNDVLNSCRLFARQELKHWMDTI